MSKFQINTDNIEKPSSNFSDIVLDDGLHPVIIKSVEYTQSTTGNFMLKLKYETIKENKFIFDQIMDDPSKQINGYKLGRLLKALNINPKGEVSLKDMEKIIGVGKKLVIAIVTKPGSTFTNIDLNKYEGYYPFEATENRPAQPAPQEPVLNIAIDDETF